MRRLTGGDAGAEMTPETLWVIRVQPHGALDPLDAFRRASQPGQQLTLLDDDEIAVRVQAQRTFLMVNRLVILMECQLERGQDPVHVGIVIVQRQRSLHLIGDLAKGGVAVFHPAVHPSLADDAGFPRHARARNSDRARWRGSASAAPRHWLRD